MLREQKNIRRMLLSERQHFVRFLDEAQEVGHRRDGAGRTTGLRSALKATSTGKDLAFEFREVLDLLGNIEVF